MRRSMFLAALFFATIAAAETRIAPAPNAATPTEAVNWTSGVPIDYDGSGNIRQIGNDLFFYDNVSRLVQATVNKDNRNYEYDGFGNRQKCITSNGGDCQNGLTIQKSDNHIAVAGYDAAGDVIGYAGVGYTYDDIDMLARESPPSGVYREHIYTADDQRIATYTAGGTWNWTLRDAKGTVLRELTSGDGPQGLGTSSWKWARDYVWRDNLLLASRQPVTNGTSTYHYHLDQLGTPRRITDGSDITVGFHDYYAFGPETGGGLTESNPAKLKYTGHERDSGPAGESYDTLDYMHARYYSPTMGRFFSVDPVVVPNRNLSAPQRWNRYAYAMNNPFTRFDPDGLKDTIYIVNTVGGDAFNTRAVAALNAAVKGTRFEGHIEVIGPMATRGMLQAWVGHADNSDMVGILIHSGGTKDWKPSLGGFMMTQLNLGDINKGISGTTLANWASKDGSTPAVCMIGGCNSQQIAATVNMVTGTTTSFGTNNAVAPGEVGMAVATTLGAIAQGKSPQEAAAEGSRQIKTPPTKEYCHGTGPGCNPNAPAAVVPIPQ